MRADGVCAHTGTAIDAQPTSVIAAPRRMRAMGEQLMSERQSGDQLDLPRRPRFASREARARDLPERRAADDVAWRTEVRRVEHIEHVHAELQAGAAPELSVLDERQVRVAEGRPGD